MDRRRFVVLIGGALAAPRTLAQPAGKRYRIGLLSPAFPLATTRGFQHTIIGRLGELGYVEGKNLVVEARFAEDRVERLGALAAELVVAKVDLIVALSTLAAQAAKKATSTVPIVFVAVVDPVGSGVVASLARPGGNVTGFSTLAAELGGKRLELMREVVPALSRVAVLANPANPSNPIQRAELESAARRAGVQLQVLEVPGPDAIDRVFQAAVRGRAGAVIVLDDTMFFRERGRIAALASQHRLPAMQGFREAAHSGVPVAYGTSLREHYERAATYVDRILKGAKPAELPVEQPTKFELVINQKAAKAIGLVIPRSVLVRADEVIE